jgi:hypothetical protein
MHVYDNETLLVLHRKHVSIYRSIHSMLNTENTVQCDVKSYQTIRKKQWRLLGFYAVWLCKKRRFGGT